MKKNHTTYNYSQSKKKNNQLDNLISKLDRLENGPTVKLDLDELKNRDRNF